LGSMMIPRVLSFPIQPRSRGGSCGSVSTSSHAATFAGGSIESAMPASGPDRAGDSLHALAKDAAAPLNSRSLRRAILIPNQSGSAQRLSLAAGGSDKCERSEHPQTARQLQRIVRRQLENGGGIEPRAQPSHSCVVGSCLALPRTMLGHVELTRKSSP
jgi:hypothetical protein